MIDHEYQVYAELVAHMRSVFPGLSCSSTEQTTPPELPHLAFEQLDCPVAMERYYGFEQFVAPRFRAYAYTDDDKVLAKQILAAADEFLHSKGFIRTFGPQKVKNDLPNVFQMETIYDGNLMDENGVVYRR